MTNGYTSIALVGPGGIGSHILTALLLHPTLKVTVIARTARPVPSGAVLKVVDFESPASLEAAMQGQEVVISTLGIAGLGLQGALSQAAKNAGAKLFVPSEFGNPTKGREDEPVLGGKAKLHGFLESIGLPYLLVYTGPFTDETFDPNLSLAAAFGFLWSQGTVQIISFTARVDIARFLAHALAHFPRSSLENGILRLEGDRKTFKEAVDVYRATHPGVQLAVSHESRATAEAFLAENQYKDFAGVVKYLLLAWDKGETVDRDGGQMSAGLWPEWKPQSVEDVMRTF